MTIIRIRYSKSYCINHNIPDYQNPYFKCPNCEQDTWYHNNKNILTCSTCHTVQKSLSDLGHYITKEAL